MLAPHALTVQGRIFLDRCGQLFAEVLSLLRVGPEWRPPEDRCAWRPVGPIYVGCGCGVAHEATATAAASWVRVWERQNG